MGSFGQPTEWVFNDHNFLHLSADHPTQVWASKRRINEPRTGADVEWWIGDSNGYLPCLVQAKRLTIGSNRYEKLFHQVATWRQFPAQLQAERLVAYAAMKGRLAVYAFWNGPPRKFRLPKDGCGRPEQELRGCTLALACDVARITRTCMAANSGTPSIADIAPVVVPWTHPFCCNKSAAGMAERFRDSFPSAGDPNDPLDDGPEDIQLVPPDSLPQHVRELIDPGARRVSSTPKIGVADAPMLVVTAGTPQETNE